MYYLSLVIHKMYKQSFEVVVLRDYIEERAISVARYIVENGATVRQAAKKFGVSKSTVHMDVIS